MMDGTASNAVDALARVVRAAARGEAVLVPVELRARRRLLCTFCTSVAAGRCRECGCFVAAKSALATERCPKGRW